MVVHCMYTCISTCTSNFFSHFLADICDRKTDTSRDSKADRPSVKKLLQCWLLPTYAPQEQQGCTKEAANRVKVTPNNYTCDFIQWKKQNTLHHSLVTICMRLLKERERETKKLHRC